MKASPMLEVRQFFIIIRYYIQVPNSGPWKTFATNYISGELGLF